MQRLFSLGPAAVSLQVSVATLRRALEFVGAEPALVLNNLAYYTAEELGAAELAILAKPSLRMEPRQ